MKRKALVKPVLETLEAVIPQGVEIQLKILQTLVSLLTTTVHGTTNRLVQGDDLGQVPPLPSVTANNECLCSMAAGIGVIPPPLDFENPSRSFHRFRDLTPTLHVRL